jgi:hypothetical protein
MVSAGTGLTDTEYFNKVQVTAAILRGDWLRRSTMVGEYWDGSTGEEGIIATPSCLPVSARRLVWSFSFEPSPFVCRQYEHLWHSILLVML